MELDVTWKYHIR